MEMCILTQTIRLCLEQWLRMVKMSDRLTFPLSDSSFTVVLNVENVPFLIGCLKHEDQSRCFYSLRQERRCLIKTV